MYPGLLHITKVKFLIANHSFIHSGYFYSTSSSPLLFRGAPDTARIQCQSFMSEFHTKASQATVSEGLAQGPYVTSRAGFELETLRTKDVESTNEPSQHEDSGI